MRQWGAARLQARSAAQDAAFQWVYAANVGGALALLGAAVGFGLALARLIGRPLARMTRP